MIIMKEIHLHVFQVKQNLILNISYIKELNFNTSTLKLINNNNNKSSNFNTIPIKKIKDYKNANELKARLIAVPSSSAILKNTNININNNNKNYESNSNKIYLNTLTRKIINADAVLKSTQMNDSLSRKQNNNNRL